MMESYFAEKDNYGIFLSRTEQLDTYLKNGFSIYRFSDDKGEELIASPEKGYLVEKPILEISVFQLNKKGD